MTPPRNPRWSPQQNIGSPAPQPNYVIGLLAALLGVLLMILMWVALHICVDTYQWNNCGATPGRSIGLAIFHGKPSFTECFDLAYAKQARTNP